MTNKTLARTAFAISLTMLPIVALFALGTILTGYKGLNAEYSNRLVVYAVPDSFIDSIKLITIYFFTALSIGLGIFTALNLKQSNKTKSNAALFLNAIMILWLVFISWALTSHPGEERSQGNSGQSSGELQIRQIGL